MREDVRHKVSATGYAFGALYICWLSRGSAWHASAQRRSTHVRALGVVITLSTSAAHGAVARNQAYSQCESLLNS